jgi:prepilin-type N-terminal cleavage/methylation domain-containing protein
LNRSEALVLKVRVNNRGFTLIELLVVVAIIGILSSLLIPNVMVAMQKAKQKATMQNIVHMGTSCVSYITDNGSWFGINQDGPLLPQSEFCQAIHPYHSKTLLTKDEWGNTYYVYVGPEAVGSAIAGIPTEDLGPDDFLVASMGRDRQSGPTYTTYDPSDPDAGIYMVVRIGDFDEDLVNWNGSWIIAPRIAKGTT